MKGPTHAVLKTGNVLKRTIQSTCLPGSIAIDDYIVSKSLKDFELASSMSMYGQHVMVPRMWPSRLLGPSPRNAINVLGGCH